MQNQPTSVILCFGASDPVAATGVQADLATFSAMACHGLPVLSSILIGDTSETDQIYPVESDLVSDQARTVLEDIAIHAIKVGQVGSIENVTVIAEIVADYPEMPLILDPFNFFLPKTEEDPEDLLFAISELLIPQASLLLISGSDLARLSEIWKEEDLPLSEADAEDDDEDEDQPADKTVPAAGQLSGLPDSATDTIPPDVRRLLDSGCEYVLLTGVADSSHLIINLLYNETGLLQRYQWQRIEGMHLGASATLSAAITALLACGLEMPEAVFEAQEFTYASIKNAQRLGMGKLVPDRYFWAKQTPLEEAGTENASTESDVETDTKSASDLPAPDSTL